MMITRKITANGAAAGNPRRAIILRQIRVLEKRKKELEKLIESRGGGSGPSGSTSDSSLGESTAARIVGAFVNASRQEGGEEFSMTSAGIAAKLFAVSGGDPKTITGGGGPGIEAEMDLQDLLKLLLMIELQINALLQQLDDGANVVLSAEDDDEGGSGAAMALARLPQSSDDTSVSPAADASVSVDQYA